MWTSLRYITYPLYMLDAHIVLEDCIIPQCSCVLVRTCDCVTIWHVHYPINKNNRPGATRRTSFNDVCISSGLAIPTEIQARCLSRRRILYVCVDGVDMPTEFSSSHHGDRTRTTATSQPGGPPFSISILYIGRFTGSRTRTAPGSDSNSLGALIDITLHVPIIRRPRDI